LYIASTGRDFKGSDCDAASRWNTTTTNLNTSNVQPTWINFTDNDSLSAVVVYQGSAYLAGHQKGCAAQAGRPFTIVASPGMCRLDAKTGAYLPGAPTTSRQRSLHVRMYVTPQGLLYVGDVNKFNGKQRNDIALFPLV
jgi:hypothetical protein